MDEDEKSLFDLVKRKSLMGWCWETTSSVALFLNDDDCIERGYLNLNKNESSYYHSWIAFDYNDCQYVFDPCLDILCKKKEYYQFFDVKLVGCVDAKSVKEELIRKNEENKEQNNVYKEPTDFERLLQAVVGKDVYEESERIAREYIRCSGTEDVNLPFYRGNIGYKPVKSCGKIKKLTAHFGIYGM